MSVRKCRVCGCTDFDCRGCIERTGVPCHWVERDLCSACVGTPENPNEKEEAREHSGRNIRVI
jgi:hypothetical protein